MSKDFPDDGPVTGVGQADPTSKIWLEINRGRGHHLNRLDLMVAEPELHDLKMGAHGVLPGRGL
jgi:hypothetical protein